jgi:cytochrome bd-type quinol oxidase subunit 2
MFLTFLFVAPVAVTYSFRARKNAPDRLFALAAFAGSFILGAFLAFMLAGIISSLFIQ